MERENQFTQFSRVWKIIEYNENSAIKQQSVHLLRYSAGINFGAFRKLVSH